MGVRAAGGRESEVGSPSKASLDPQTLEKAEALEYWQLQTVFQKRSIICFSFFPLSFSIVLSHKTVSFTAHKVRVRVGNF